MEVSIPDESSDLDADKFKDLWIFLCLVLDNAIYNGKKKFSRYPSLIPIALVRLLMKQMEELKIKESLLISMKPLLVPSDSSIRYSEGVLSVLCAHFETGKSIINDPNDPLLSDSLITLH
jgi:hypothetical protein